MCGRFVSSSPPDELAKYFDVEQVAEKVLEPSFNVAPSNDIYVVLEQGGARKLDAFHWGLIPFWAKDVKTGLKMINARAETVTSSGAYKHAFKKRRCIIPADGFYEWRPVAGANAKQWQPYFIRRLDGEPLAFAGVWESWYDPTQDVPERLRSCAIVTTVANDELAPLHHRMPVVLPAPVWDRWLDPSEHDVDAMRALCVPLPDGELRFHPVSTLVNKPDNNGPELVEEVVLR